MPLVPRLVLALLLAGVAAFCLFGLMATFEPLEQSTQLGWRTGYTAIGIMCLGGAAWLIWPRRRQP
jgi:hypothetical protein